jgi:hypothetical protein
MSAACCFVSLMFSSDILDQALTGLHEGVGHRGMLAEAQNRGARFLRKGELSEVSQSRKAIGEGVT